LRGGQAHRGGVDLIRQAFITVTDYDFFPGTLATVGSVREFAPAADVFVVQNDRHPLTAPQADCLARDARVRLLSSSHFETAGRYINAWELKAYAAHDLCGGYDVIIGIDSDCLLCSNVDDVTRDCLASGKFIGGQDGGGVDYDESYRVYGIPTPARNPRYMSTSLYFCAVNDANRRVLRRWAECCNAALFNATGPHPGHGDQGVLNAVLFAENGSQTVELLDNRLWSQHWVYWDSIIEARGNEFLNRSAGGRRQRAFHCGGGEKYWAREHRDRVFNGNPLQTYPYVWFLAMLWFGACRNWGADPYQYLPPANHHLAEDLVHCLPQIMQVFPAARHLWNQLTDVMIDRLLDGIPRALSLGGGSMSEVIDLVATHDWIRRYAEIGGYEGGSILALGLRFANRDVDFYSVESFMGNLDGTMDGHPLPSRQQYMRNLRRYPGLRVNLVPGDSALASQLFDDKSIDFLFIDGCHETAAVLRDIDTWLPKVSRGGIIAGDDYGWDTVRHAVRQRFARPAVTRSGNVWWARTTDLSSDF
jgi:hypothetical protein